jgi:broad specificity phosphatase PhoE
MMTGKMLSDIKTVCPPEEIFQTPRITYFLAVEGAETFPELYIRAKKTLTDLQYRHPKETILLLTH